MFISPPEVFENSLQPFIKNLGQKRAKSKISSKRQKAFPSQETTTGRLQAQAAQLDDESLQMLGELSWKGSDAGGG